MDSLVEYVVENCIRGICTCGRCMDSQVKKFQQDGHTVDVQFFRITLKNSRLTDIDKEVIKTNFIQLVKNHKGKYNDIDLFDGNEHNLIEIGRWIGHQGSALELMGMGELLGLWKVVTPNSVAPDFSEETRNMLAEAGYISIKYSGKMIENNGDGCQLRSRKRGRL